MSPVTRPLQILLIFVFAISIGLLCGWVFVKSTPHPQAGLIVNAAATLHSPALRVVYLSTGQFSVVDAKTALTTVVTLSNPELVLPLDAQTPLDALVFDAAFADQLDQRWLHERYVQGMAVVGVNVPLKQLSELVDDKTVMTGPWLKATPPPPPFYSMLQLWVRGNNPTDVARYLTQYPLYITPDGSSDPVPGITDELSVSGTRAQSPLLDGTLKYLFRNLELAINDPTP